MEDNHENKIPGPRSPRKHKRLSLTNQFGDLQLGEPSAPMKPAASEPAEHGWMSTLRGTIQRGWPNWSGTISKASGFPSLPFTIRMNSDYIIHSSNPDPIAQFEEAQTYFLDIQCLHAKDPVSASEIIQNTLVEEMSNVIFGSNYIERAGEDLLETMRICQAIFRGEEVDDFDERSPNYQRRLENFVMKKTGAEQDHIIRSRREVIQHAFALQHITDAVVNKNELWTEGLILDTHRILCQGIDHPKYGTPWRKYGGKYRNILRDAVTGEMGVEVNAGGTCFTPSHRVPDAMRNLVRDLNADMQTAEAQQELDPYHLAAKYCAHFVWIHPFLDGNGRMCRLILNAILLKYAGIVVPIGEHDEERDEYIAIKRRYTGEAWGPGEFAAFLLNKATLRLQTMRENMRRTIISSQ